MQNTYRSKKWEFAGIFEQRRTYTTYDVIFDAEEVSGSNPLSPTSKIPQMAQKWRISALLSGLFDTNRGLGERVLHSTGGMVAHARYNMGVAA